MMDGLTALYIFMLAAFTGYEIIAKVPVILHTREADAMVADIVGEVDPLTADEGEARCVAQGIVDQIGVDRLAAEGITAETTGDITEGSFSDDEIDSIVRTMFEPPTAESPIEQLETCDHEPG